MNLSVPIGIAQHFRNAAEGEIQVALKRIQIFERTENITPAIENPQINETSVPSLTVSDITIIIWFTVVILMAAIILLWILHTKKLLNKCPSVTRPDIKAVLERKCKELGIKQEVNVYYLDVNITDGPTVTGIFNPKIFLPRVIAENWTIEEIEPLLSHELVHIKQHDLLVNWLQIIFQVIFFFHPIIWYVNWKIRQIREEVCDDIAIQLIDNKRKRYSRGILNVLEEIFRDPSFGFVGLGFSERKSSLAKRIIRITNKKYTFYKPMTSLSIIVLIVISALSISIACDKSIASITSDNYISREEEQIFFPPAEIKYLTLKIIKTGEYEVEGIPANSSNIGSVLKEVIEKNNNNKLSIQNNANISFEDINYIMNLAYSVGFKYIIIE